MFGISQKGWDRLLVQLEWMPCPAVLQTGISKTNVWVLRLRFLNPWSQGQNWHWGFFYVPFSSLSFFHHSITIHVHYHQILFNSFLVNSGWGKGTFEFQMTTVGNCQPNSCHLSIFLFISCFHSCSLYLEL